VGGRQGPVPIAEVVLAEPSGGIAQRLQELGNRRVLRLEADRRAGQPDFREAGAKDALAGDERGAPGR
jgi:hypothetical protein